MTKAEKHYKIAEMAVLGCHKSPKAITSEECAICQFNGDKCNQWQHAEKLLNKGYRPIEWHKVAEGDWPKEYHEVRFVIDTGHHHNGYFVKAHNAFYKDGDIKYDIDEVIAWTELPTYSE